MVDKYAKLIKQERDQLRVNIDEFNRGVDIYNRAFLSNFNAGIISLDSPYVQSVLDENDNLRREGLDILNQRFDARVEEIRGQENKDFFSSLIDAAMIGASVFFGGSLVTGALTAAKTLTTERRKTDPTAPEVQPNIPYSELLRSVVTPALNSASNIITRSNFRYNR